MKRPLIGLAPLIDEARDSYWMLPGYMQGVERAGGIPVMLPLTTAKQALKQLAQAMDGFLFTGGQDVSPALYHSEPSPACEGLCPMRDAMEVEVLRLALAMGKPLLGICRGTQLLNAALGGSLYQDLPTERPSQTEHCQRPPYDRPAHAVHILRDTPLHQLLRRDSLAVNSYHHQAVKELAPSLRPMAYAEDGLVEAVWLPGEPWIWAVQWHPEYALERDEHSLLLFRQLVEEAQ